MRNFLIFVLIVSSPIWNNLIAEPSQLYFERVKGKGFLGKLGQTNQTARYKKGVSSFLNENGELVIVAANYQPSYNNNAHVITVKFDPDKKNYYVDSSSVEFGFISFSEVEAVEVEDEWRVYATADDVLYQLDATSLNIIKQQSLIRSDAALQNFQYGDANNDGKKEIVLWGAHSLLGIDPVTWQELYKINLTRIDSEAGNSNGGRFQISDIDNDSRNEVILDGYAAVVLEMDESHQVNFEFRLEGLAGQILDDGAIWTEDLDGDDVPEIIYLKDTGTLIQVYSGITQEKLFEIETSVSIRGLEFHDFNADGLKDFLVAHNSKDLLIFDHESQSLIQRISTAASGCAALLIDDIDNDSSLEIFTSCGHNSSDGGYTEVFDLNGSLEWKDNDLDGPFHVGGFSDPEEEELIILSSRKKGWRADGTLVKLDRSSLNELWDNNEFDYGIRTTQDGFRDLTLEDVNGDGHKDAIFGKIAGNLLVLHIFDSKEGSFIKTIELTVSDFGFENDLDEYVNARSIDVSKLKMVDINNDNINELIITTQGTSSGAYRLKLYIYDLLNEQIIEEYTIPNYGAAKDIFFDDHNNDGVLDILLLQGYVAVIDRSDNSIKYSEKGYYRSLDIIDSKYYAGSFTGLLAELSKNSLEILSETVLCGTGDDHPSDKVIEFKKIHGSQLVTLCRASLGLYDLATHRKIGLFHIGSSLEHNGGEVHLKRNGSFFDIYFETFNGIEYFKDSDFDNDGIGNILDDDDDNDGVLDQDDPLPLGLDFDGDGVADEEDPDDDNDGVLDDDDAFPFDASESFDNDSDGVGDNADTDDDNDGVLDDDDAFPFDASESFDNDLDGVGDNADSDDDNDGVLDDDDAFPFDSSESFDNDLDGIGDNADSDDDNDGMPDDWEEQYGLDPLSSSDRNSDLDNDGDTNYEEYQAGTDPTVANNTGGGTTPPPTTPPPSSDGGGGSTSLLMLLVMLAFAGRRYYR